MLFPFQNTFARLPETFFARVDPTPVTAPQFIAVNQALAVDLGIDPDRIESGEGLAFLSGNRVPDGAEPLAAAYSGHQFGGFSPVLGDGRAILLGEVIHRDWRHRDIQLKGAGATPFSRRGDGRSALGPVLREYLVSEAMAALGLPTTRALAAVWTGDKVYREEVEPGGVFTRVASSHLRIGSCEYFASRGDVEGLRTLVGYALTRHYPERVGSADPAVALLEGVMERQADLVARWMGFGFIHGVMNTDNMSLSGETIDYGPCAFLDRYDPAKKFSYIDQNGRYAYGNQPNIAHWNLTRLAEALLPCCSEEEEKNIGVMTGVLDHFPGLFRANWDRVFSAKIGFASGGAGELSKSLLEIMLDQGLDFTLTFRHLREAGNNVEAFLSLFSRPDAAVKWLDSWRERLKGEEIATDKAAETMRTANPVFIPRNHRIEEVILAAKERNFSPFHRLHEVLRRPYDEQPEAREFESPPRSHEEVQATFCGT